MSNNKIDKIVNIIWLLAVAPVIVSLFLTKEDLGLRCVTDILEQKEYYEVFLWPAIYGKVAKCTIGAMIVALVVYVAPVMDEDVKRGGVSARKIKNMAHITTCLTLVFYILFTLFFMKGYTHWMIYFAVVVLMGIGFTIRNVILCKKIQNDDLKEDKEKKTENKDQTDIDEIWKPVLKYFNILSIAVVICVLCFSLNLRQYVDAAKAVHYDINYDLIRLSFEHEHGMEENRALVKVMFVNLYNESGRQYSMEVLEEEYKNFQNGTGTWSTLWQFCRDSVEIEHAEKDNSKVYLKLYDSFIPDSSSVTAEYFLADDYEYLKVDRKDYKNASYEFFADLATFTYDVELNLNAKGLTMRQSNDSSSDERELDLDFWCTVTSATQEEVRTACEEVYLGESALVSVKQIDFEIDNVAAGDCVMDSTVVTETEYVTITDVSFYEVERISGKDYLRDQLKGEEGIFQEGEKYTARIIVQIPLYVIVDEDVLRIKADVGGYEYTYHSVDENSAFIEVKIDIVFRAQ